MSQRFQEQEHTLLDNHQNKKYEPKLDENGDVLEDYALIFKVRNPYNDQKNLFVVTGCFGYGTYSGAEAITNFDILREISRKAKARSMGVIIKSYIIQRMPQKPSLVEVLEFE